MKFSLKQLLLSLTCASLGMTVISLITNTRANEWEANYPESAVLLARLFILYLAGPFFGAAVGILVGKTKECVLLGSILWLYLIALFFAWIVPKGG